MSSPQAVTPLRVISWLYKVIYNIRELTYTADLTLIHVKYHISVKIAPESSE
jgi:hypothetical protein